MNKYIETTKRSLRKFSMVIISVLIVFILQILTDGILLRPQNITNLILQNAYIIIIAIGMMMALLTGGNVDLSVGSVCAFIGAICGYYIIGKGYSTWLILPIAVFVSLLIGAITGLFISKFETPAFIASLAMMLMARGGTYILLQGVSYTGYPSSFTSLTTGYVPDIFNNGNINLTSVLVGVVLSIVVIVLEIMKRRRKRKYNLEVLPIAFIIAKVTILLIFINFLTIMVAQYKGIPKVLILVAIIALVYNFIMNKTVYGRNIYAIGGNRKAAILSGIRDKAVFFGVFVNSAFLAGIAGIVFSARMNSCSTQTGVSFELDAIAACFIGGTINGTIGGAVIGAFVMGVLNNGMSILGMASDAQMVIKGIVLLFAVVLDIAQKKKVH